jgi:hypothetical protein
MSYSTKLFFINGFWYEKIRPNTSFKIIVIFTFQNNIFQLYPIIITLYINVYIIDSDEWEKGTFPIMSTILFMIQYKYRKLICLEIPFYLKQR